MLGVRAVRKDYPWGSPDALARLLRVPPPGGPVAELWYGDHPAGPAPLEDAAPGHTPATLADLVAQDPDGVLGADVVRRFGPRMPYLVKLIAPASPLSLQVHPTLAAAREGWAREEAAGLPAELRSFRDANHKPEIVHALTHFEALCGFRAPRRVREVIAGLDAPLARRIVADLDGGDAARAVRRAFGRLLRAESRPDAEEIAALAETCRRRLTTGSPSPRADAAVVRLHEEHPGDPGVVASLLLNPVTLRPGEALFVPPGAVHAYLGGVAVELQASSDNVLRAGLTRKRVDVPLMLEHVDFLAAPPVRVAPEVRGRTRTFYAPVDDFELAVTRVPATGTTRVPGRGPRLVLVLGGDVELTAAGPGGTTTREVRHGRAVLVRADESPLRARVLERATPGAPVQVVQADVP